jgi:hypothetical protein
MASRRALAVLCVAWMTGRVVDGFAYPEKITYATPDPAGAQRFAEKHFGMLRRVFNFQSKSSSACAQITWNTICHDAREMRPPFGNSNWNWEWCVARACPPFPSRTSSPACRHAFL